MTDTYNAEDVANSLNYFEELAISAAFGCEFNELDQKGTAGIRALAFVLYRREALESGDSTGKADKSARDRAFEISIGELNGMFTVGDGLGEAE